MVGNVQKLLLGILTVIFDSIFILQHYVLYKGLAPRSQSVIDGTSITSKYDALLSSDDYEIAESEDEI